MSGLPLNGPAGPAPHNPRSGGLLPAPDSHWTPGPAPSPTPYRAQTAVREAPAPTPAPSSSEPPRPPIPANNRIFVDGQAYEVQYIEDTPVIEWNCLPHKIYFTGPPRDVVIDGVAHQLAFGDRKTVSIDGQPHVIRFGAPSRELYMGNLAIRGAFGGPPIYAPINGQRHEISLCGPPPEVKIEPEPAHEIMRFLDANAAPHAHRGPAFDYNASQMAAANRPNAFNNFTGYAGSLLPHMPRVMSAPSFPAMQPQAQAPATDPINIIALLDKLKQSGVLASTTSGQAGSQPPTTTGYLAPRAEETREMTPPHPCQFQPSEDEVVERRLAPPPELKSIVDALYSKESQRCSNCGLRFSHMQKGTEDSRYKAHLDWHYRENSSRSKSRPWFYPRPDWVTFTELADPAANARSDVFEAAGAVQAGTAADSPDAQVYPQVIVDANTPQKCDVCAETFERKWDDEEENWVLKDALRIGAQVMHIGCVSDASITGTNVTSSTMDDSAENVPFIPESSGVSGSVLPGLSLKVEVKTEPVAFSNSSAAPIDFTGYAGSQPPHMPRVTSAPSFPAMQPQAQAPATDPINIIALLDKLKQSGVLASTTSGQAGSQPPTTTGYLAPRAEETREMTPPHPCQFQPSEDEVVERRLAPPPELKSIVDALYSKESQRCSNCGLRFSHMQKGTEDSRYKAHLDWHYRENSSRSKSRPWFYPRPDWVTFTELADPAANARSDVFEAAGAVQAGTAADSPDAQVYPQVIVDANTPQKCDVCAETFERKWDDEEENWVLKDALRIGAQVMHIGCVSDASITGTNVTSSTMDDSAENVPFIPESSGVSGSVLPGLSLKVEVKTEPVAFSNSSAAPIDFTGYAGSQPPHMPRVTSAPSFPAMQPQAQAPATDPINIIALLDKLKQSGVLASTTSGQAGSHPPTTTGSLAPRSEETREITPPHLPTPQVKSEPCEPDSAD